MEFDFLTPVSDELIAIAHNLPMPYLGRKIVFHTRSSFPELSLVKIAIVGVTDSRGAGHDQETDLGAVRRQLYSLFPGNWAGTIADLGDIDAGNSPDDTSFALRSVAASLLRQNIIPIVIGGSQDLTYAFYRAYDKMEQMVNLVCVDSRFDFGAGGDSLAAHSYLSRIIADEPNNLFNFSNIGYQTYYNPQEEIDLVEKMYFDAYRLGEVSANISVAEPVMRDADLVSIDLTAVKSADSGNFTTFEPNGFSGKEICALARYAGISDRTSGLGIFNQSGNAREAVLIAQIIWYFIEGWHYRSNEYPFGSRKHYVKYIVAGDDSELVFYKSDKTDRWWIEIPFLAKGNNKLKKNTLLPCSYDEYLAACNQELPERWWKAQRKNAL